MTTIPQHKPAELVEVGPPRPQKLHVALFGDGGTGKSRFGVTCPGLGVIPLNAKCRATVEKERMILAPGKKILWPKDDLIRHGNPMKLAMMDPACNNPKLVIGVAAPQCCAKHYYRWHINRVKDACWTMAEHPAIRTIMIDDATQLYADILYAHYGRANQISEDKRVYGPPNSEMVDLINSLDSVHLILVHQAKEEYRGNNPTGRDTVRGYKDVGFYVNVLAEMSRDEKKQQFSLSVRMCQDNAGLHGDAGKNLLTDSDITFADLAMKIFGENCDLTEYL